MSKDLLLVLQPPCHLHKLILMVVGTISILCKVNMETLCMLCVEVVCCPKEFDQLCIMACKVKLGEIEIIVNTKLNKDLSVCMKAVKSIIKQLQSFISVNRILCQV